MLFILTKKKKKKTMLFSVKPNYVVLFLTLIKISTSIILHLELSLSLSPQICLSLTILLSICQIPPLIMLFRSCWGRFCDNGKKCKISPYLPLGSLEMFICG